MLPWCRRTEVRAATHHCFPVSFDCLLDGGWTDEILLPWSINSRCFLTDPPPFLSAFMYKILYAYTVTRASWWLKWIDGRSFFRREKERDGGRWLKEWGWSEEIYGVRNVWQMGNWIVYKGRAGKCENKAKS